MPAKKKSITEEPSDRTRHSPVQEFLPDADVYYADEKTRRQVEAGRK